MSLFGESVKLIKNNLNFMNQLYGPTFGESHSILCI